MFISISDELFELSEFKDCIYQKYKKPHPTVTLEKGNSKFDYKKKYLALLYLDLCDNNPAEAIMKFQKDWGKIFSTSFITSSFSSFKIEQVEYTSSPFFFNIFIAFFIKSF